MTERAAGSRGLWVGLEGRWVCTDEGRLHCATLSLLSLLSVLVGFGEGPECLKNFTRGARDAPGAHRRRSAVDFQAWCECSRIAGASSSTRDAAPAHSSVRWVEWPIKRPARGSVACAAGATTDSGLECRPAVAAVE